MGLVVLGVVTAVACSDSATGPEHDRPGDRVGGFGTGRSSFGSTLAASLIGTWQAVVQVPDSGTMQTVTTTWKFAADSSCRETRVTESVTEDIPCTWTSTDSVIMVTLSDGGTLVMEFAFDALSPDQLILDGVTYQRQA